MRNVATLLAGALLVLPAAPAVADEAAAPKERKICKLSNETATRLATRTCLTAKQWRAVAKGKQNSTAEAEAESFLRSSALIPEVQNGGPGRTSPGRDN